MKLPRSVSAAQLIKALARLGYLPTRQSGSHVRLVCRIDGHHSLTIPMHDPLRVGTLAAILSDVAAQRKVSREDLVSLLFP